MKKLIELDAAIEAMSKLQGRAASKGELTGISKAWKRIKALPTIDAVPARHGHWVKWYEEVHDSFSVGYTPHYKCSECDTEYDPYDAMRMNYCPRCGVKFIEDIDGRGKQHGR